MGSGLYHQRAEDADLDEQLQGQSTSKSTVEHGASCDVVRQDQAKHRTGGS